MKNSVKRLSKGMLWLGDITVAHQNQEIRGPICGHFPYKRKTVFDAYYRSVCTVTVNNTVPNRKRVLREASILARESKYGVYKTSI